MKVALISLMLSFSTMAADCYVRSVELATKEVSLAKEVCIEGIDLELEVFGDSRATIRYTVDGTHATREVELSRPFLREDGTVHFMDVPLQSSYKYGAGGCSDLIKASIFAQLVMKRDGSEARIEKIDGSVGSTLDTCHDRMREIQSFTYTL